MLKFLWILSVMAFLPHTVENEPDYLEWSSKPLQFSDFKSSPPSGQKSGVHLSTVIGFQTKQIPGKVPQITIYNRMERNSSWILTKKQEVLRIQQIHFDFSELYARKIRKEIKKMNQAGVKDLDKYKNVIKKYTRILHKTKASKSILLDDQPHLIALREKEITDSLKLYKDYTK